MKMERTVVDQLPGRNRLGESEREAVQRLSLLKKAWRHWLGFAEIFGTIQMVIVLTLVYWIFAPLMGIPLRLFADPLGLRGSHRTRWVQRDAAPPNLEAMKKQF